VKGKQRGIGVSLLLFLVTFGIYGLVWAYKTHDEIKRSSGIGVGGLAGVLIFLLVAPVTLFLLPHEVKQLAERRHKTSRVSALTGLWILLPLIGPIVWFVKVQGQLNDIWAAA
jgi:Domain of unknown function (DUF4234)